jgi:hypothetical protein
MITALLGENAGDISGMSSDGSSSDNSDSGGSKTSGGSDNGTTSWSDWAPPMPFYVETAFAFDAQTHSNYHNHTHDDEYHNNDYGTVKYANVVAAVHSCHMPSSFI